MVRKKYGCVEKGKVAHRRLLVGVRGTEGRGWGALFVEV